MEPGKTLKKRSPGKPYLLFHFTLCLCACVSTTAFLLGPRGKCLLGRVSLSKQRKGRKPPYGSTALTSESRQTFIWWAKSRRLKLPLSCCILRVIITYSKNNKKIILDSCIVNISVGYLFIFNQLFNIFYILNSPLMTHQLVMSVSMSWFLYNLFVCMVFFIFCFFSFCLEYVNTLPYLLVGFPRSVFNNLNFKIP